MHEHSPIRQVLLAIFVGYFILGISFAISWPIPAFATASSVAEYTRVERIEIKSSPSRVGSIGSLPPSAILSGKALYNSYVDQIHNEHYPNVPTSLVKAIITVESNWRPDLTNAKTNATGLMQVLPKYHAVRAEKYGYTDLLDPYANILAGMDLLNELYESAGNWKDALHGYNRSWKYVDHVLWLADQIEKGGS